MGDPKTTIWEQIITESGQFIMKMLGWIISISLAVAAKLAFEINRRTLRRKEIIAIIVISYFIGYLAATYFDYKGWNEAGRTVVPLITLLGQSLMNHIMTNWKSILEKLFNIFIKNGNGKH